MTNVIQNGCFEKQTITPWFTNYYPDSPVMPHYQDKYFSVLFNTNDHMQQNIPVRRDAPFTARWEFTARLISDTGGLGARILTGLYADADHQTRSTVVASRNWQTYAYTDDQAVFSRDGYLGIVFSDPISMPDPGLRTTVQMTGFKLWIDYLPT